jgi:hypothetical protein
VHEWPATSRVSGKKKRRKKRKLILYIRPKVLRAVLGRRGGLAVAACWRWRRVASHVGAACWGGDKWKRLACTRGWQWPAAFRLSGKKKEKKKQKTYLAALGFVSVRHLPRLDHE